MLNCSLKKFRFVHVSNSDETHDLTRRLYAEDIARFGYKF